MAKTEQQIMDELAEALRNLLAFGSRYNGAAKVALKGYEAWRSTSADNGPSICDEPDAA